MMNSFIILAPVRIITNGRAESVRSIESSKKR